MALQVAGLAALGVLLALVAAIAVVFLRVSKAAEQEEPAKPTQTPGQTATAQAALDDEDVPLHGGRRGGAADRMRNRLRQRQAAQVQRQAQATQAQHESDTGSSDGSDAGSGDEAGAPGETARNKKQRNREARREAREAERAAREAREARVGTLSAYEARRQQRDAEREAQEAAQEAEMRRAAEEKARREEEEAAKWMGMITVEQQGTEVEEQAEAEGQMGQFVEYIKARKTVPLEELAADFKLRTKDAIDRIQALEAMGTLTGVMDDRGKYIYISREEMQAVADFVRQKGRVGISELAAKSSTLINLEPKAARDALLSRGAPAICFDDMLGAELGDVAAA